LQPEKAIPRIPQKARVRDDNFLGKGAEMQVNEQVNCGLRLVQIH
jgi:hypothetical protein